MISIKFNFLFIHVPKTAGNSIQNTLRYYSDDKIVCVAPYQDGVERFEVRNDVLKGITKHSTLSEYRIALPSNLYGKLFKFATMRNPWDRLVSMYFSPHRGKVEWNRNDFITLLGQVPAHRHYITASETAPDGTGNRELTRDIDYLMKFENLSHDFKNVCERIGISFQDLPRRNSSQREHYSRYYDKELI
jgi:hypothetical protein